MASEDIREVDEIDPDRFVRWIFPKLVEHRRPLYQALADRHGYTVDSREVERVRDEADFLDLVADALNDSSDRDLSAKRA